MRKVEYLLICQAEFDVLYLRFVCVFYLGGIWSLVWG